VSFGPFATTTSESENVALSLAKPREAQAWLTGEPSYVPEVLLSDAAGAAIPHTVVDRGYTNLTEFPSEFPF
jgi:hypothetical protein